MCALEWNKMTKKELYARIDSILSFQFTPTFAKLFLEKFEHMNFEFSPRTGKIRYIKEGNELLASYISKNGTFSIMLNTVLKLYRRIPTPKNRVKILSSVSEFIENGKSVFAKHVVDVDPNLLVGDQVFVVDQQDKLLAVGKLEAPPHYLKMLNSGVAVSVKKGIAKLKQ